MLHHDNLIPNFVFMSVLHSLDNDVFSRHSDDDGWIKLTAGGVDLTFLSLYKKNPKLNELPTWYNRPWDHIRVNSCSWLQPCSMQCENQHWSSAEVAASWMPWLHHLWGGSQGSCTHQCRLMILCWSYTQLHLSMSVCCSVCVQQQQPQDMDPRSGSCVNT